MDPFLRPLPSLLPAPVGGEVRGERAGTAVLDAPRLGRPVLPTLRDASIGLSSRAADGRWSTGGDFCTLSEQPGRGLLLAVGDIEGKGQPAAPAAARTKRALAAASMGGQWPHTLVAGLNALAASWDPDSQSRSCAVCVMTIRAFPGGFAGLVCNAGSPLPVVVSIDGDIRPLGPPGLATGYLPEHTWNDRAFTLVPGDTLIVATDGLTDARSRNRLFGEGRFEATARAVTARHAGDGPRISRELLQAACRFTEPSPPRDDMLVLVLALRPVSPLPANA